MDDLSQQNRLLQQDKYDLDDFRKLYSLDEKYSDYPKVAAHVISSDGNWFNSFVIDKGSKDGLKVFLKNIGYVLCKRESEADR